MTLKDRHDKALHTTLPSYPPETHDMSPLMKEHAEAGAWVEEQREALSQHRAFARIEGCIVWADTRDTNGNQLVPVDSQAILDEINSEGLPLLVGHDPGAPSGRIMAARLFTDADGRRFVAAVAGIYSNETRVGFADLGLTEPIEATPPTQLPSLPNNFGFQIATDPREVSTEWLDELTHDAPVGIVRRDLSHNAAEPLQELIRIAWPYVVVVWNPFVTTIAKEAGKDAYAAVHQWFRKFLTRLSERMNPIVEIQAHQRDCHVSFLFRGKDVERNYAAHDKLPLAGAQAAKLIDHLLARDVQPRTLVYEFEPDLKKWYPSFAELIDGRIVTDRNVLIAFENLPTGLSLGLVRHDDPRIG